MQASTTLLPSVAQGSHIRTMLSRDPGCPIGVARGGARQIEIVTASLDQRQYVDRERDRSRQNDELRGDRACGVVGHRHPDAAFREVLDVGAERLLDPRGNLVACGAQGDHARHVREVGTPPTVLALLIGDYALAQRKSSRPLAFRMLPT